MKIDFSKLARIRDDHDRLHAEYRHAAERARQAATDAGRLRLEALVDPHDDAAVQLLTLPAEELAAVPTERLNEARVDLRLVRRLLEAHQRAQRLRSESEAIAARLRTSRALLDRLEAYAARFE